MTENIKTKQTADETTNTSQSPQHGHRVGTRSGAEGTSRKFNRYLYDQLVSNVEAQTDYWNRRAVREPSPATAHALRLKAEGLGYALRLLYTFEPEFRELVDCASRSTTDPQHR